MLSRKAFVPTAGETPDPSPFERPCSSGLLNQGNEDVYRSREHRWCKPGAQASELIMVTHEGSPVVPKDWPDLMHIVRLDVQKGLDRISKLASATSLPERWGTLVGKPCPSAGTDSSRSNFCKALNHASPLVTLIATLVAAPYSNPYRNPSLMVSLTRPL